MMTDKPIDAADAESVPDPRQSYDAPADVLADTTLSAEEQRDILCHWKSELDDRLKAEEEGMSASEPMHNRDEAALANEFTAVTDALARLDVEES
jgi:hypothetical protein